jgi:hypothetical protein
MAKAVGRADARLTEHDERHMQRIVKQYRVSYATAVQPALAWSAEEEPPRAAAEVAAVHDLTASNRVGANLNQVVRAMHRDGLDQSALATAMSDVMNVMNEVNENVSHQG